MLLQIDLTLFDSSCFRKLYIALAVKILTEQPGLEGYKQIWANIEALSNYANYLANNDNIKVVLRSSIINSMNEFEYLSRHLEQIRFRYPGIQANNLGVARVFFDDCSS